VHNPNRHAGTGGEAQSEAAVGLHIFALLLIPVAALLGFFLWGFLRGRIEQLRRPAPPHTETSALGILPHRATSSSSRRRRLSIISLMETAMAIDRM